MYHAKNGRLDPLNTDQASGIVPCAVSWQTDACKTKAEKLSKELNLPLLHPDLLPSPSKFPEISILRLYRYVLYVTEERLELRSLSSDYSDFKIKIYAEFLKGPLGYRRLQGGGAKQMIARAVGLKKHPRPRILDATAGLGQDAFVLASLGCSVQLIERSPIVAALLQDGLNRAKTDPIVGPIVNERMHVEIGDALEIMKKISSADSPVNSPDVVYLDPMFPSREKSALTKIEMRIIRDIVGEDRDAPDLLEQALHTARERVVVKRPAKALSIANKTADFIVEGSRNRYDVYLI